MGNKGERDFGKDVGRGKLWLRLGLLAVLLLQLLVLLYYGGRKAGFHEDEFYSFYSTNKTAGLVVTDREWLTRDQYRNDFVVLEGEQFRYDVVKQMQSWDVHPPLYYYILHTVCSLFPGVFSKWLGIAVNLLAFVPCFFLLFYLVKKSCRSQEKGELLGLLVCLFWGFGAAVISGVMFIRMYQWLTLSVLLCACLHVKALKNKNFGASFLIPLAVTVFLGFLTQYYYIIFHFFLGAGFCFLLLTRRRIKELLAYAGACGAGLLGAILYYPSCLSHIFRGYRGTEAVSEFGNAGNTLERLRFFGGLFDDYMLNGTLPFLLLVICLLLVTASYRKKRQAAQLTTAGWKAGKSFDGAIVPLLLFSCAGYFFTVSKTALLLGETSNRYQLPVYGILLFLLLYGVLWPLGELLPRGRRGAEKAVWGVLLLFVLLTDGLVLKEEKVFFLYEDRAVVMEYVKENREVPVVVFYHEASPANVWRLSDELMEFPQIYTASQGNTELITDPVICESQKLLVYVADHEEAQQSLKRLQEANPKLTTCREVARIGLFTLYEMSGKI